ncbi:non-ribosomal peptide synthetase [Streptomyces sp. L2]|uniref:non-ribosomal peptide synthetase n=1 Tax=Streptomyces sp. L2 TaxID=2162665 RepID=UPI00101354FD|nr:non-ribosomal peptide synthetase [Streptomyces sp. L2]
MTTRWPTSFAQRRLWLLDQLNNGNGAYNLYAALRLRGELHRAALETALHGIGARHDALRTRFLAVDGEPFQVVDDALTADLRFHDLSALPAGDREARTEEFLRDTSEQGFDLASGPLVRFGLLRRAPDEHIFTVVAHHSVWDGWSAGEFLRELAQRYAAHREGRPVELEPLPLTLGEHAERQRREADDSAHQAGLQRWTERLAGAPGLLTLPTAFPRPATQGFEGAAVDRALDPDLWNRVTRLARQHRATPFMVLLAGFSVLMSRLAATDDVVIGTPSAGRTRPDLRPLIGMFVNTLPLRVDLSEDPAFETVLGRVRRTALDAFRDQDVPLELIVSGAGHDRAAGHDPLFQVMFSLQQSLDLPELPGLSAELVPVPTTTTFTDLWLDVRPADAGSVSATFRYRTELFDAPSIERMADEFDTLLRAAVDAPDTRVTALPLLDERQRALLLGTWSRTAPAHPWDVPVQERIRRQAERTPHATAVTFGDNRLTYAELVRRAEGVARRLRASGDTGPDTVVGICLPRGQSLVVSILAVLATGSAFLPLSPDDPATRRAGMLRDAGATHLLTAAEHLPGQEDPALTTLLIDDDIPGAEPDQPWTAGPEDLAYVICTSGSTGRPKPVAVAHHGLDNRIECMQRTQRLTPRDRVLYKTPHTFDVSVCELLWPLAVGARLVIAAPGGHRDPAYLVDVIERESVTSVHFVPPMLDVFLDRPDLHRCVSLRRVLCSGQALTPAVRDRCAERLPTARLVNMYGPTEASIEVTEWDCGTAAEGTDETCVPIGRPLPGVEAYVLDRHLNPCPIGVPGELYLGGVALARGYLGRPDLTADRFVPHPYADTPGARLYRTGDLVAWRADAALDYLGRTDQQLKIRGFRIEPGEIENLARAHPAVAAAAVHATGVDGAEPQLALYLVPAGDPMNAEDLTEDIRGLLRDRLPDYMVPRHIMMLPELPVTTSGKVDRAALPTPAPATGPVGRTAPADDTERLLADIWADVLGLAEVGVTDDFFELGGDSLQCARIAQRVCDAGMPIGIGDVFRHPSVRELAGRLRSEARR